MTQHAATLKQWLREEHPDLVRVLRLLRHEVRLASVCFAANCSPWQWRVRRRLWRANNLRVQIGSGDNPAPEWVNIDGIYAADLRTDLRGRLPLRSGSVAYIFTEHFLDHLEFPHGVGRLLRECRRVLKVGGVMRVVVHDGPRLLRAYLEKDAEFFEKTMDPSTPRADRSSLIACLNYVFHYDGFHQFIYDYETLERQFLDAGFSEVRRSSFRGSTIVELNLDSVLPHRPVQSLYVEAVT